MNEFYYKITTLDDFKELLQRYPCEHWSLADWGTTTLSRGGCFRILRGNIAGWNRVDEEQYYIDRGIKRVYLFSSYLKQLEQC